MKESCEKCETQCLSCINHIIPGDLFQILLSRCVDDKIRKRLIECRQVNHAPHTGIEREKEKELAAQLGDQMAKRIDNILSESYERGANDTYENMCAEEDL